MSLSIPETNPNVFSQDRIWMAYELSLTCPTDKELAIAMGVTEAKLKSWKDENSAFYRAIVAARARAGDLKAGSTALANHISNNLPEDLRELWDSLQDSSKPDNTALMALATKGDYDKQRLLLHALASTNFDLARCMKLVNVSHATLDRWARYDARFTKLWEEVHQAKKAFVESALMELVAGGNTRAILFTAERLNKETYGPPVQRIEGNINHNHKVAILDLNKLNLSADVKMAILDATREAGLLDMDGLIDEPGKRRLLEVSPSDSR